MSLATKHKIKLIFGRPYSPRGRGKIEAYHKVLYRELISLSRFYFLSHFRKELWKFDQKYNKWRKREVLGWQTPASVYRNKRYFNKQVQNLKKRTEIKLLYSYLSESPCSLSVPLGPKLLFEWI